MPDVRTQIAGGEEDVRHDVEAAPARVLVLADYYLPGYQAGGPIRSLENLAEALGDEFSFTVLTRDRDLGAVEPYPSVRHREWASVGAAEVSYLHPTQLSLWRLAQVIRRTDHDVLYLNSLFSVPFGIKPLVLRRLGMIPQRSLVVAPRGELSPGALGLHSGRKHTYLAFAKLAGLFREAVWHAASVQEASFIRGRIGPNAWVVTAGNVPPRAGSDRPYTRRPKEAERLRVLFLSRVAPMKNLLGALSIVAKTSGRLDFEIYGPLEDKPYWAACQKRIAALPDNVRCHYRGDVPPEQVTHLMCEYDLFFLPSLGESYGHVVIEALLAGCPVLISDQTPWRGLEQRGAGWDIPLIHDDRYREVLERCISMSPAEHEHLSRRARTFGLQIACDETLNDRYKHLFRAAARRTHQQAFGCRQDRCERE